jgi:hypothetical protein
MDGVRSLLGIVRDHKLAKGRLRGLFHLLIGHQLATADGTILSAGLTWRQLAAELKAARLDKDLVAEVGADPDTLSPRDRERFWYSAIGMAQVDSAEARTQAEQIAKALKPHGFTVVTSDAETKKKKKS